MLIILSGSCLFLDPNSINTPLPCLCVFSVQSELQKPSDVFLCTRVFPFWIKQVYTRILSNKHYHAWTQPLYHTKAEAWQPGNPGGLLLVELPNPRWRAFHKTTCYRVSTTFYLLWGNSLYNSLLFLHIRFILYQWFLSLNRAFQEYENLTATLENNRNYLSDSYGDFLFNNDEYLWTPVRTYYKKRLL